MNPILIITLLAVIFITIFAVTFNIIFRQLRRQEEQVRAKFPGKLVLMTGRGANFAGQKSKGLGQVRGNGVLLLFEDMLHYEMLLPQKTLSIPLEKITRVGKENSFLAKTKGIPLMVVEFTNEDGQPDAAGWWVNKLDEWVAVLEEKLC